MNELDEKCSTCNHRLGSHALGPPSYCKHITCHCPDFSSIKELEVVDSMSNLDYSQYTDDMVKVSDKVCFCGHRMNNHSIHNRSCCAPGCNCTNAMTQPGIYKTFAQEKSEAGGKFISKLAAGGSSNMSADLQCTCGHRMSQHTGRYGGGSGIHQTACNSLVCPCYVFTPKAIDYPDAEDEPRRKLIEYTADQLDCYWSVSKSGQPCVIYKVGRLSIYVLAHYSNPGWYVTWYSKSGEKKQQQVDSYIKLEQLLHLLREAVYAT